MDATPMPNPAPNTSPNQRRLRFPAPGAPPQGIARMAYLAWGLVAFPFYWLAGAVLGVPGMAFRWRCFAAGLQLAFVRGHLADAYHCLVTPMDSVRHFEMDFFWVRARAARPARLLDVSSPRLLSLLLLRADPALRADLVNPDAKDLARTQSLAGALGVATRCTFSTARIDAVEGDAAGYPLVVCMSVLEHIVDDLDAMRRMWALVAPGGRLLLSVPCAPVAAEEYTNVDEYELLDHGADGLVFWQRYYDPARLQALFDIAGQPVRQALYAERVAGAYDADVLAKRTDPFYPRWREPFATARAYAHRENVATLPGMGVVAMEFHKPART